MLRKPKGLIWKIPIFCLCGAVLLWWVYQSYPCPIRELAGIPCPGCGMGRAWLSALRLDLPAAFGYHPMFWAVPVLGLFALYDLQPFQNRRVNDFILAALGIGLLACYVIRLTAGALTSL